MTSDFQNMPEFDAAQKALEQCPCEKHLQEFMDAYFVQMLCFGQCIITLPSIRFEGQRVQEVATTV